MFLCINYKESLEKRQVLSRTRQRTEDVDLIRILLGLHELILEIEFDTITLKSYAVCKKVAEFTDNQCLPSREPNADALGAALTAAKEKRIDWSRSKL